MYGLADGNRSGSECRVDEEGLEVAHNGVRGDDVVVVREARRDNGITNSDEGGRHHVRTQSYGPRVMGAGVADRRPVGVRPRAARRRLPAPAATPTVEERLDTLEKKVEAPSLWKTLGFKASGFLDVAYTQNFNNPNSNLNQLHIFDTNANAFMAHLFQLMVERPAEAGGSALDRAGFRARLNFGLDSRVTRARTNYQTGHQQR